MIKLVAAVVALSVACSPQPSRLDDIQPSNARPDPTDIPATIDKIANDVLEDTHVPSASLAAVRDGKIIYVHAYGNARVEPNVAATPAMRYSIGSVSKQLTAVAILMLVAEGKLALDDAVGKYVPNLMRGDDITIRQILSHTSGYRDYAPQDYMIPEWTKPIADTTLVERWAHQPLDFEPGTKWQYSNTNFVIAGMICEQVTGEPLFDFLKRRVFDKLGMTSVVDVDRGTLAATDPQGYFRRANGPLHPAPAEAAGWKFGAYELGMTAEDLAKWDISMIDETLLPPALYKQLETETLLANGAGTHYGLGISVGLSNQHRELSHGGEASGFVSENIVLPDDRIAVAVLTNQDASGAASQIAGKVKDALVRSVAAQSLASETRIKTLLIGLALGTLDRTLLTDDANAYFTPEAIDEYKAAIDAAGALDYVEQASSGRRGGMTVRRYTAHYADKSLTISVYEMDDGRLEQFLIE
jgi:CubicO group peptidase (beta-lactamase class C family)